MEDAFPNCEGHGVKKQPSPLLRVPFDTTILKGYSRSIWCLALISAAYSGFHIPAAVSQLNETLEH